MALMLSNMDRISQLPEPILQKILCCLPAEDAAHLSLVSRTWKALWDSLPVSHYRFYPQLVGECVTSHDDPSLTILLEHDQDHQKRRIYFRVREAYKSECSRDHVNRWLELVGKHYVQELRLEFACLNLYQFPPDARLDLGSLVVLSLHNCELIGVNMRFSFLQELYLFNVDFNGTVGRELLSRCPSLETLKLIHCRNINHLQLLGFHKLKDVVIETIGNESLYRCELEEAPNLNTLSYWSSSRQEEPLDLEAIGCTNLKKLTMRQQGTRVRNKYVRKLISDFPNLEELALEAVFEESGKLEISSHDQPKSVTIYSKFAYMPPVSLFNLVMKLEVANLNLSCDGINGKELTNSWFVKLRKILGKLATTHRELNFSLSLSSRTEEILLFSPGKIRRKRLPPPSEIKNLLLDDGSHGLTGLKSLIDGILWSCHPITLSVTTYFSSKLMEVTYEELMCREENPGCCGDRRTHTKCWRHYIKSVKIQRLDIFKDDEYSVHTFHGQEEYSSINFLTDFTAVRKITFELQWLSTPSPTLPYKIGNNFIKLSCLSI